MKKLILFLFLIAASLPLHAQEEEPQPEEPTVERILQNSVWIVADKLDFQPTDSLPYRFAIGAPRGDSNVHYFLAGKYTKLSLSTAFKFNTSANTNNGEGIVKGVTTTGNVLSSEYYQGDIAPICEIVKTENNLYNIAYIYQNTSQGVLEKRWIGLNTNTKQLCYVNSTDHSETPPTKTGTTVIADLSLKWKDTGKGAGYYQIWWGNYILKAQGSFSSTASSTAKSNGYPVTFYWSLTEGNTTTSYSNQDVEARLYIGKQISYTNTYRRELDITVAKGETITFPITATKKLQIMFPKSEKIQFDTLKISSKVKDSPGNLVKHVSKGGYLGSSIPSEYKTVGAYSSQDSLEWRFIICRPTSNDLIERIGSLSIECPPDLYSDNNIAYFPQRLDSLIIGFGCDHMSDVKYQGSSDISYAEKNTLTIDHPSLCGTIVEGFTRSCSADGNKQIYSPINHKIWNLKTEEQYNSINFFDHFLWEENNMIKYAFSSASVSLIRLHPSKPDIHLNQTIISHSKSKIDGLERISFPAGLFEPGSTEEHYARIVLTPQFQTFNTPFEAEDFYGEERRGNGSDSWMSAEWYEQNNLDGFMPEIQWDETKQEYFCELNGHDMTYEDHEGNRSEGYTLVSGHYKAKIVPSLGENDRQYGIVPSDPVDIFIYPSLYDMKMNLCVRDEEDGESRWEPYDISNEDFSFEGPAATDHGETAYRHARLEPAADFCEVWVESSRHRPSYPEGHIPGQKPAENAPARKAAPRAALVSGDLTGYTKVEPDDYIDLSGTEPVNIKLVKNGVASPAQAITVAKSGDEIITGIDEISVEHVSADAEYFTPAGMRIAAPSQPGLYIERRGGKTRKVALR